MSDELIKPQALTYVIFTEPDGALGGFFDNQVPPEAHVGHLIVLAEPLAEHWTAYRANAARDAVELAPAVAPLVDLSALRAAAIAATYADIDALVWDAVGRRTEEYKDAEADARAFTASGSAEPAPESVAKFAQKNPTMQVQTNAWAAQQVLARADALAAAKKAMRDQRFDSQWDMRAAATHDDLDAARSAWDAFIAGQRAALGL
jgi:hypothetical protein